MVPVLSQEEWMKRLYFYENNVRHKGDDIALLESARQGMILESEAVRIPPVSEWPKWAKEARVTFFGKPDHAPGWDEREYKTIFVIPRPAPEWTPKVGEKVFAKEIGGRIEILIINSFGESGRVKDSRNLNGEIVSGYTFKPFHPDHIGKPWDEIPGVPS